MRALVTGATGFVGRRLVGALAEDGVSVRCLVRDAARAAPLADAGHEVHEGDVLLAPTLRGAGHDVDVAYYLIHAMGRGGGPSFDRREREGALAFARMARDEGIERVVYLGALGDRPRSLHLRTRRETAEILAREGPPLTHVRASIVVGAGSEGLRLLRFLVERLPAMVDAPWISTLTQPVAVDDAIEYLRRAPTTPGTHGREVQIGGPDVVSYGELIDRVGAALGRARPARVATPWLTPTLSSWWIGFFSPLEPGLSMPLVEGLSTETVVTDPSGMALFDIDPLPLDEALRRALAGERASA